VRREEEGQTRKDKREERSETGELGPFMRPATPHHRPEVDE